MTFYFWPFSIEASSEPRSFSSEGHSDEDGNDTTLASLDDGYSPSTTNSLHRSATLSWINGVDGCESGMRA